MSGNAAAVLTKPAFRKIEWLERDIAVERRPDGVIILKSRIPLKPYEKHIPASLAKGPRSARAHLAGATRGGGAAMAQTVLRRCKAQRRRPDAGAAQSEGAPGEPGREPRGQFNRTRADDAGRHASAISGSSGFAGLLADEPGSPQAEIPFRPDQASRGHGAGRTRVREGAEGARSRW